jgi:hypothetical protein
MEPAASIPDGSIVMFPTGKHVWMLEQLKVYGLSSKSYKTKGKSVEPDDMFIVIEKATRSAGEPIYEMEPLWVDLECTDSSGANLLKFVK